MNRTIIGEKIDFHFPVRISIILELFGLLGIFYYAATPGCYKNLAITRRNSIGPRLMHRGILFSENLPLPCCCVIMACTSTRSYPDIFSCLLYTSDAADEED